MKLITSITLVVILSIVAYLALVKAPINPRLYKPPPFISVSHYSELVNEVNTSTRFTHKTIHAPESLQIDQELGLIYTGTAEGAVRTINTDYSSTDILLGPEDFHNALREYGQATGDYAPIIRDETIASHDLHALCLSDEALSRGKLEKEKTEHICGRVLGIRYDAKRENLLIANAYFGLFSYNFATKKLRCLTYKDENNQPFKFVNDVVQHPTTGIIYFTDTSLKFYRRDYRLEVLEARGTGRLFSYDLETGKTTTRHYNLHFANAVALSSDLENLYVVETSRFKVMKYNLKTGDMTLLIENLPIFIDNIRIHEESGMIWATGYPRSKMVNWMASRPWCRTLLTKFPFWKIIIDKLKRRSGIVVGFTEEGQIKRIYHDPNGVHFAAGSEAQQIGNNIYIGSIRKSMIVKIPL